ncbi:hypothetical protein ACFXDH_33995 [Streptomyces sp. NPDC059467]|uniref:hypothetical protein n=1 Tax=Streptomyces sp. NPDC059467 TaxID=3346844 RepID=UPI0036B47611
MRVLRTAAGRRALQLALLVGGLLALGFLCGGQAQAAEGVSSTPSLTSVVTRQVPLRDLVTPHRPHKAAAARKPATAAAPVVPVAGAPVAGKALGVPEVGETVRSVTRTVTSTTSTVTRSLDETVRQVSEQLPVELPALPALPVTPVVQVPELPVVSELPGVLLPAPVTSAPRPAQPRTPVMHDAGQEKPRTKASAATAVSYGPRSTAVPPAQGEAQRAAVHRAVGTADAPTRPAPAGDPDGALGKSAVDGTASRHADAYAVTFADRAPLRLVPGAAARVDAAGTRDRFRDIPVFPG